MRTVSSYSFAISLAACCLSILAGEQAISQELRRQAAYGSWHDDNPGVRRSKSSYSVARAVAMPAGARPQGPGEGAVSLATSNLRKPRVVRVAPNGDLFVAESRLGTVHVLRSHSGSGKPTRHQVFATGLKQPFGIAFYPLGDNPSWVYIANSDGVVRFRYKNGDLKASGKPERIVEGIPTAHHPNGNNLKLVATGLRNCEDMTVEPATGELWCIVNERDELGDNTPL